MFRNAVVCTDLSSSSHGIVKCAGQLGVLGVENVVLVHVIEIDRPGAMPGADGDAVFARQVDALEAAGIKVRIDTAVGYAPYEIERIAVQHESGLIVAGSHGKGLFDGVMSGSVSSDLVRIAARPILLTAPSTGDDYEQVGDSCAAMLGHVLFPSDFSGACERAGHLMLDVAEKGARAATLLHVVQQSAGTLSEYAADDSRGRLAVFAEELHEVGVEDVRIRVMAGDAERIVAQAAASGEYSLIVMGPHCEEGSEAALDSVTNAALQKTVVPILLAPPGWRP
jgi:nucleotide-binding universal stress UspA family protein